MTNNHLREFCIQVQTVKREFHEQLVRSNEVAAESAQLTLLALGGSALGGCQGHVTLSAPPRSASLHERVQSYTQLRPLSMHETHITYLSGGVPTGAARRTDYLQLANGQRIYYAEDILPVVDSASPAAVAAKEAESARDTGNTLFGVGIGGIVVGPTVMMLPLITGDTDDGKVNQTPLLVGAAISLAGVAVWLVRLIPPPVIS